VSVEDPTFDEIDAEYTPSRRRAWIVTRGDLVERLAELNEQLVAEQKNKAAQDGPITQKSRLEEIAAEIVDLEAEAQRYRRLFVFESLGRQGYRDLIAEHPPTDEQKAKAREENQIWEWNPETFLPELVARACVKPVGITPEKVAKFALKIGTSQWDMLYTAALDACRGDVSIPSYASALRILGLSAPKSNAPSSTGSLAASS
jgi:hypothetical protein